jgi:phosphatidylinositol alpha-1,6-mannosyltransferase
VQYFYANEIVDKPRLTRFAAAAAQASIAISSYTAELLAAAGADDARVHLIPPGVDQPAEVAPLAAVRPTLLTVSRLAGRYKGHDVLIEALPAIRERVPDVEWVVIGDGPLRGELEGLAHARGLSESVRFLGAVEDRERDEWLRRCNVFAMPSRLPGGGVAGEGFGIVFLEAGVYGKPVVAGAVGGALDAVEDGVTGLLVDPADPRAVGEAVATLLSDRERARQLGANGAERAREHAWPLIAEQVRTLMLDLLAARA